MNYKCVIWSNSSHPREYEVHTRSAVKAGLELGRCEFGEVIEIRRKRTDELLSKAMWEPWAIKNGGYVRIYIPKNWRGRYE